MSVTAYAGPDRRLLPRGKRVEPDPVPIPTTQRMITCIDMITRLLAGGYLDRDLRLPFRLDDGHGA